MGGIHIRAVYPQRCVQISNAPVFLQVWTAATKMAATKGEKTARKTVGAPRGVTTTRQVSCKPPWGDGLQGIEFQLKRTDGECRAGRRAERRVA